MIKRQLIRCARCNALALLSSLDQTPEYYQTDGRWEVLDRDDQASFLRAHRGHRLEPLHVVADSFISHQDYGEPIRTSYFLVTNGKQHFVVKKSRKNIFDPQRYELIAGRLRLTPTRLRVDGTAIRRELERVFLPSDQSSKRIENFVTELEEIVAHLTPGELKRAPFESHNPSLWYFYLDEAVLEKALKRSSGSLTKRECRRLDEFVRKNLEDNLFMAMAKVEFQIESSTEHNKCKTIDPDHRRLNSDPPAF